MDVLVTHPKHGADSAFDTARIAAAVEALAEKHAGREDMFRSAVAQLLKAELIAARATAQTVLLRDRHGRRCAERLCFVQDEIIRILFAVATQHLYRSPIPSGAERMAVVATGGYGRGLMAPESDIDLLFILPYKQTAWGEQVAEAILYCLWDMGLKVGHATRSVDESIRQARGDMTIRTAILEMRFLAGDRPLYDELVERFDKDVAQEYRTFRRCADLLWSVRCNLHFIAGRAEERLSFDLQRDIAVRLGYTSHPGMRDVERFMKHYFLIAKDVGDLTAIMCAELEARQAKDVPMLNRVVARFRRRPKRVALQHKDFIVDHNRISIADAKAFERD